MKAISICPPWAQAILAGIKTVEVRSWRPKEENLPMRVLVHASQKEIEPGDIPNSWLRSNAPFRGGVMLGAVTIDSIVRYDYWTHFKDERYRHLNPPGWFRPGLFGWCFKDPVKFAEPIKYKGRLRIFEVPFEERDLMRELVKE